MIEHNIDVVDKITIETTITNGCYRLPWWGQLAKVRVYDLYATVSGRKLNIDFFEKCLFELVDLENFEPRVDVHRSSAMELPILLHCI